jgi:methylmalonyl-CoA mutase N-terminal domain/subunit
MILLSATKEQQSFDRGDMVLVGANIFVNEKEQMTSQVERLRPTAVYDSNPKSIKTSRLAAPLELSRLDKEKS